MNAVRVLRALGPADLRSVARDPLLRWLVLLPPGIALLIRAIAPALFGRLSGWLAFDLTPHADALIGAALLALIPNMIGTVVGFLLLDQRDDGTLEALRVTPLSPAAWLAYRLGVPLALGVLITPPTFVLAGTRVPGTGPLVLAAVTGAPLAVLTALFLAAFAHNKVQGFALAKISGVVLWPPLVGYFVPLPEQLLFGVVPTYWAARVHWSALAGAGPVWGWALAGLLWQGTLAWLLLRRFLRRP